MGQDDEKTEKNRHIGKVNSYSQNEFDQARSAFLDIQKQSFTVVVTVTTAILGVSVTFVDKFRDLVSPCLLGLLWSVAVVTLISMFASMLLLLHWYKKVMLSWLPSIWSDDIGEIKLQIDAQKKVVKTTWDGYFLSAVACALFVVQLIIVAAMGTSIAN